VVVPMFNCSSGLCLIHPRHETNPPDGVNQGGRTLLLEFAAQIAQIHIQGVGVAHKRCSPDSFQDLLPG